MSLIKSNLVLIDSNLKDTHVLLSSLNAQTAGILYNYNTSRKEVIENINDIFSNNTISRISICSHENENRFLENENYFDTNNSINNVIKNSNTEFILNLLVTYKVPNIDFLACNSLKYDIWKKYYELIETEVKSVIVGASENLTGNIKYGGDWVMENTGEHIDNIYFNKGIEYYRYLFNDLDGSETLITTNDGTTIFSSPSNDYVKLYDNSGNFVNTILSSNNIGGVSVNYDDKFAVVGLPQNTENKNIKTFEFNGNEIYDVNDKYISGDTLGTFVKVTNDNVLSVSSDISVNEFTLNEYNMNNELEHNAILLEVSYNNISYGNRIGEFNLELTTNEVSILTILSNNYLYFNKPNIVKITEQSLMRRLVQV